MTNTEILEKAISRAMKNGLSKETGIFWKARLNNVKIPQLLNYAFIFSHDFAKAFWGTKSADMAIIYPKANKNLKLELKHFKPIKDWKLWEYHLINMVLEKDPIPYLARFLD